MVIRFPVEQSPFKFRGSNTTCLGGSLFRTTRFKPDDECLTSQWISVLLDRPGVFIVRYC